MAMYKVCSYCNKRYEYGKLCECDGANKAKKRTQQHYDKYVRKSSENKKYDTFYHTKEWERMAEHVKNKYNNLCVMCLIDRSRPIPYDVIHHIYEIKTGIGWEERLNEELLIPLCHDCHSKQHLNYTQDKIERLIEILNKYKELYEV
nr:MAG TPA: HNH endonuclease [Caudoviricetes sp.]